jgi:hypothetical protein
MIVKQFNLHTLWLFPLSIGAFVAAGLMATQTSRPFATKAKVPVDDHAHGHHAHAH